MIKILKIIEKIYLTYIWHVFGMVLHICVIADLLCFCVYMFLHWYLMQNNKYFMHLSSLFAELWPFKYLYHNILEYIQRWRVMLKKIFSAERVNDTKTHNILLYPPYECTRVGGGGTLF